MAAARVRERLLELVRRPALPEAAQRFERLDADAPPPGELSDTAKDLVWERWLVRSEPGDLGRVPVLLAHARRGPGAARLPVVLVLHGTSRSKDDVAPHLARYARQGYLSASFDSRYHGERGNLQEYYDSLVRAWRCNFAGPEGGAPGPSDEHPFMYDSVWDLGRVLDLLESRPDVDPARIGATGISLGGMHVWLGAVADPRLAAAAPAIGVQGYRYAIETESWGSRVATIQPVFEAAAADLHGPGSPITTEVVEKVWRRICPGILDELDAPSSLRCIAPRPLLVVNGEKDPRCPIEGVRAAVEAARAEYGLLGAPEDALQVHVAGGVEHEVTPEMWQAIDQFFAHHLRPQHDGSSL